MEHREAITKRLEEIGLSQQALGEMLGLTKDKISFRMTGRTKFTATEILRIGKLLQLNLNKLE